jgi:hypothetical protein
LAKSGDSLVLSDSAGTVIDAVNSGGGAWVAGNSTTKASMERINSSVSGDDATNWASSDGSGSVATSSAGTKILGTPKMLNSKSSAGSSSAKVSMVLSSEEPKIGDEITLNVDVSNVQDLFSYGFRIEYDPAVLAFESSAKGIFLGENGAVSTSFQAGLEDSDEGTLLIAEARTQDVKSGVSGNGNLFTVNFKVIGGEGTESIITFGTDSFISDLNGDLLPVLLDAGLTPQNPMADTVKNLAAAGDSQRYAIKLSWQAPANGAEKYKVYRLNQHGAWVLLGEASATEFVDSDAVAAGGKIIPELTYKYRVTSVNGTLESAPAEVTGTDARGLKGDNTRSDLVDGRDLEALARNFAMTDADSGFNPLTDTTYDGITDGNDLIDLGANFARVYR